MVDIEEDIDAASELWDTPGVKAIVNRLNRVARINKERFNTVLEKPVARNPPQPEGARSDPQEAYAFGPGSSYFPEVTMEAMRKEYINFIRQPILFQERVDEDMAVCHCSDQPHEIEGLTAFFFFALTPRPAVAATSAKNTSTSLF